MLAQMQAPTLQALKDQGPLLRHAIHQQFQSHGETFGTPWPTLQSGAPATLVRSRRLLDSLTDPSHPQHVEQLQTQPPFKLIFGTTVPYAAFHHFGTKLLPRRALLPPSLPLTGAI